MLERTKLPWLLLLALFVNSILKLQNAKGYFLQVSGLFESRLFGPFLKVKKQHSTLPVAHKCCTIGREKTTTQIHTSRELCCTSTYRLPMCALCLLRANSTCIMPGNTTKAYPENLPCRLTSTTSTVSTSYTRPAQPWFPHPLYFVGLGQDELCCRR